MNFSEDDSPRSYMIRLYEGSRRCTESINAAASLKWSGCTPLAMTGGPEVCLGVGREGTGVTRGLPVGTRNVLMKNISHTFIYNINGGGWGHLGAICRSRNKECAYEKYISYFFIHNINGRIQKVS